MKLAGRINIVTGAAKGIGAAIAREFAREGAVVAALDRKAEVGKVCEGIVQAGGQASAHVLDITDQEAYRSCVEQIASKFGRIDGLVNNAAVWRVGDILTDTLEQWREVQKVNLEAVYWGSKLVAPYMVRQRHGRIITIASVQAMATDGGAGSYVAAKGALVSFTKSLAVELAPHRVLANAIAPGFIHTSMSIVNGVDETETELFKDWYFGRLWVSLTFTWAPCSKRRGSRRILSEGVVYEARARRRAARGARPLSLSAGNRQPPSNHLAGDFGESLWARLGSCGRRNAIARPSIRSRGRQKS